MKNTPEVTSIQEAVLQFQVAIAINPDAVFTFSISPQLRDLMITQVGAMAEAEMVKRYMVHGDRTRYLPTVHALIEAVGLHVVEWVGDNTINIRRWHEGLPANAGDLAVSPTIYEARKLMIETASERAVLGELNDSNTTGDLITRHEPMANHRSITSPGLGVQTGSHRSGLVGAAEVAIRTRLEKFLATRSETLITFTADFFEPFIDKRHYLGLFKDYEESYRLVGQAINNLYLDKDLAIPDDVTIGQRPDKDAVVVRIMTIQEKGVTDEQVDTLPDTTDNVILTLSNMLLGYEDVKDFTKTLMIDGIVGDLEKQLRSQHTYQCPHIVKVNFNKVIDGIDSRHRQQYSKGRLKTEAWKLTSKIANRVEGKGTVEFKDGLFIFTLYMGKDVGGRLKVL